MHRRFVRSFSMTPLLKRVFDPDYVPSHDDVPRPPLTWRRISERSAAALVEKAIRQGNGETLAQELSKSLGIPVGVDPETLVLAYVVDRRRKEEESRRQTDEAIRDLAALARRQN
jgi:hypothetical protein